MNSKKPLLTAAAGLALLGTAGCGSAGTAQDTAPDEATGTSTPAASSGTASSGTASSGTAPSGTASSAAAAIGGEYQDGEYTAKGSYIPPSNTKEEVTVSLTLSDGVVTDLEVSTSGNHPTSKRYQAEFTDGVQQEVVGKPLDEVKVDKIASSSLTSSGFNKALDEIKSEAAR
ncbi:FMN-binding protein [Arthrobacter citreus]|uniref:FMN-binding protein n=1 Tax=Arthrobacter citreus TaxID=1670 RepID=UPI0036D83E30